MTTNILPVPAQISISRPGVFAKDTMIRWQHMIYRPKLKGRNCNSAVWSYEETF